MAEKLLKETRSLCPECMKVIDARVVEKDGKVLIKKECPKHGKFQDIYWSDAELYKRFAKFAEVGGGINNPRTEKRQGCPLDCGICPEHKSHTVLAIVDVTNRCNLRCPICFANAAAAGYVYEPTFEQIKKMLKNLRSNRPTPPPAVQLSGVSPPSGTTCQRSSARRRRPVSGTSRSTQTGYASPRTWIS